MEKDNTQKELFEFQAPKKQPRKFGQLFQQADFAFSLNAERLVFVAIGIIMLLVISFALGVERGKAVSGKASEARTALAQATIPATAQHIQGQPAAAKVQLTTVQPQPAAVKIQPAAVKAQSTAAKAQPAAAKPYTVVAAAFSKEAFAIKESSRLKSNGLDPFVYYKEPYYLVCVGSFANKASAQKVLNRVRQMYRDAYVRLR